MLTLWIVDDNVPLLVSLELALDSDFRIQTFSEPTLCLEAFRNLKLRKPDIILVDYEMPRLNGLELLESILKCRPETAAFIFSSALTPEIIEKAKSIGAKGWITKPFEFEKLRAMIKILKYPMHGFDENCGE